MREVLHKFKSILLKSEKKKIVGIFFLMLLSALFEVCSVTLVIPLITVLMDSQIMVSNKYIATVCSIFNIQSHKQFISICISSMIGIYILKDLYLILQCYIQTKFINRTMFRVQTQVIHAFLLRPYEFFLNASDGEIVTVVERDVPTMFSLLTTILTMATESVVAIALIITMVIVDPIMTVVSVSVILFLVFVFSKMAKRFLEKTGWDARHNEADQNKWLLQAINGIKDVKISCRELFFEKKFTECGDKYINSQSKYTVWNNTPRLIIEMASVSVLLGYLGIAIANGEDVYKLIATLGAFAMAALKLLPSANKIINAFNSLAYGQPALNKVYENLDGWLAESDEMKQMAERLMSDKKLNSLSAAIELKGVSYKYPNTKKLIMDNVDVTFPIGKSIGIVGKSGAGKTTLVDVLLGLLVPETGVITSDNQNVLEAYKDWLSHIGYIPQSIFMMDGSIRDNVSFGADEDDLNDEKIWAALEDAQLADFVRQLPEGLDTQIGQRGIRISGGQRQRIGIARALYEGPEILVFDEATSSLDNETEAAIMESINSLHGKKTLIIIAHRLQTIEGCDIVYRVSGGKVLQER